MTQEEDDQITRVAFVAALIAAEAPADINEEVLFVMAKKAIAGMGPKELAELEAYMEQFKAWDANKDKEEDIKKEIGL